MLNTEYEASHKSLHYNLCWLNGEEKLVSYFQNIDKLKIISVV